MVPWVPVAPPALGGFCTFPARFDLREWGRSTPDWWSDCPCGLCWTSATLGAIESVMAPWAVRDLSENHLQLRWSPTGGACGLGGNWEISAPYLAAWLGPVDHADFDACGSRSLVRAAERAHVQQVIRLPVRTGPTDNCWIKWALVHIGGLYASCGYGGWSASFEDERHAYYDPDPNGMIHAVTIVGWDDDFDRTRFECTRPTLLPEERMPPGNGAFLVKDNRGPLAHDQGHYWISYYDGSFGDYVAAYVAEPTSNFSSIYQWDAGGDPVAMLAPTPPGWQPVGGAPAFDSWQGNVFTARAEERVAAVGFFARLDPHMDFEVQVHLDPTNGPVAAGPPAAIAHVSLWTEGYVTVRLPSPVHVEEGQRFGIVLRGRSRVQSSPAPLLLEMPGPGESLPQASPGQSFLSTDGTSWSDLTSLTMSASDGQGTEIALTEANLRIKAFATPVVTASASLRPADAAIAWELANDGREDAWVRPQARLRINVAGSFEEIGDPIFAQTWTQGPGDIQDAIDGWVRVPAGGLVTALSGGDVLLPDVQVVSILFLYDDFSDTVFAASLAEYLNELLSDPLVVTGSDPAPGAVSPQPQVPVVTLSVDEPAIPGPGLSGIQVTAGSQVKTVFASVQGSHLLVVPSTPMTSNELGGTVWHVHVPADAVLSQSLGNPLSGPYDFSFTVTGVN
jgi:C1A family cysteine protease